MIRSLAWTYWLSALMILATCYLPTATGADQTPSAVRASSTAAGEPDSISTQRKQAVEDARSGALLPAIASLRQLHAAHPSDDHVLADLIVLLREAGDNAEISQLTLNTSPAGIPGYALMPWASALRDQHDYTRARQVLKIRHQQLGPEADILYSMVTLEAGQPKLAVNALPPPDSPGLSATDLAHMAYVYRRAGNPFKALQLCTLALTLDPQDQSALREQIYALAASGSTAQARGLAESQPGLIEKDEQYQLLADKTSENIRQALRERIRLEDLYRYRERNWPLDAVLTQLDRNLTLFPPDSDVYWRTRYDRIFVLSELNRPEAAIRDYESVLAKGQHPPPYTRLAVANAYDEIRKPQKAIEIYRGLIQENPGIDVGVYLRLYYALIDAEDYGPAEKLIREVHKVTPMWLYGGQKGDDRLDNWEWMDVAQTWALDAGYRNHLSTAERRARQLMDQAPYNISLINAYAHILRWAGNPGQAAQITRLAQAYAPRDMDTLFNVAENARDLGDYALWGRTINKLYAVFPNDTAIQKSEAEWQDRQQPSISSQIDIGYSRGNNALNGSRDRTATTQLNSPWTESGWRAFVLHQYTWSAFNGGHDSYNRPGFGVEWLSGRKDLTGAVSEDGITGQHVGGALSWSQWLNDHWQYDLSGQTYSIETPLRAKHAGLSGKSADMGLTWHHSDALSASAGISFLAISDGNRRIDGNVGITQRIQASAHHMTTLGIAGYAEHNTRPGGAYFNPADTRSAELDLQHDWITWRHYEHSLTQHFEISGDVDWQSHYGSTPSAGVLYEHEWQLSRTWSLNYGLGWATHVYDGKREQRFYGLFGFSGVL